MQVPEPRFYLKHPSSSDSTLICMQVKYCGQRVFISTGEKVVPQKWDFQKQRAIVNRTNLSASTTNMFLDRIANEFKNVFRELLVTDDLPMAVDVTDKLLQKIDATYKTVQEKPKEKITFFKFIATYTEECKVLKSAGTIKTYKTTLMHLNKYAFLEGKEFDFADITIAWHSGFIKYLQDIGSAKNNIAKQVKNVKVFLNEATERGINTNLDFRSKSFSKPTEDVAKVFLTANEIQKLIDLDLYNDNSKAIVRDFFLISCSTSLRYSDFTNIRPENIKENTIELVTIKTGESIIVPINSVVRDILEKYNYDLPKAPCNQTFNLILKDICRLAGVTDSVTITKTIGGNKKSITYEKYQLISCHSGRRTFISNAILSGVSTSSIMLISAHKSLKVFQRYSCMTKKDNAEALANHIFFK